MHLSLSFGVTKAGSQLSTGLKNGKPFLLGTTGVGIKTWAGFYAAPPPGQDPMEINTGTAHHYDYMALKACYGPEVNPS